jgi:hypothetical protein
MKDSYLRWAIEHTKTAWWHDSADPAELALGIKRGAVCLCADFTLCF